MKLVTFTHAGATRIGVLDNAEVVDLAAAVPALPREMHAFLRAGGGALAAARQAINNGVGRLARGEVTIEAPILRPPKILAVGLNYKDHIAEAGRKPPAVPLIFNKQSTAVTGPTQSMCPGPRPRWTMSASWRSSLDASAAMCPKGGRRR